VSHRPKPSDEAGLGVPQTQPLPGLGDVAAARLESPQADKPAPAGSRESEVVDKQIDDVVGALTDPIIVMPGGWGETLPDWIKTRITLERLVENVKAARGEHPTGTDAEAMAYLYTASLTAPMSEHWANIYFYVFTRVMGDKAPEDLRRDELTNYEQGLLGDLKAWLWNQRVKVRQERRREKRAREKAETAARAPKQLGLPM